MTANLHHLQLFYYVARARGVSAAVKIIPWGIQQPAISQQLTQLEAELGVKLFVRRPFSLTPAGDKLLHFIQPFFEQLDTELAGLRQNAGVRIRFGCPLVISAHYLPELIAQVSSKCPELQPHVTELEGVKVFTALLDREIDVAIAFVPPPRTKSVEIHHLLTLPHCLIVPADHPFSREGFWPKTDFSRVRWIALQEPTGGTSDLREGLSRLGLVPEFAAGTNSIEAALNYVARGIGLALMAQPPADLLTHRRLVAIPATELFGEAHLTMAWRHDLETSGRLVREILTAAKELCAAFRVESPPKKKRRQASPNTRPRRRRRANP
jgi:DNA-binding transcriptional LysR family regulator